MCLFVYLMFDTLLLVDMNHQPMALVDLNCQLGDQPSTAVLLLEVEEALVISGEIY